ncbi:MAG: hypothetical protein H7210_00570 [Pyrinomonadaceae bacterium]|nr:hypothetical protein [Phycisphaerales bacterium]
MRRIAAFTQMLIAGLGLGIVLVYLVGRIATDRLLWTQYLYWVPTAVYLAALTIPILFAVMVGWVGRKWEADHTYWTTPLNRASRWPVRLTWACALCLLLGMLHIAWSECKVYRYIVRPAARNTPSLIIVHWNTTVVEQSRWGQYVDALRAATSPQQTPDVVIITNPTWGQDLLKLSAALGPDYQTVRVGVFALATRLPIIRTGWSTLDIPGYKQPGAMFDTKNQHDLTSGELLPSYSPISRVGGSIVDPGNVMFAELDAAGTLGGHFVIWAMDLPSDVRLSRYASAKKAAEKIQSLKTSAERSPFPPPDMIVGDFNTPRGSASLALLAPGMTHGYQQAGRGYAASWPRDHAGPHGERIPNRFPFFHIDHMFVSPDFRASNYALLDPKIGEHYLQRAVIQRKRK